ncbi:MAG: flagellar biosynthesis protein FliQ [Verrucomicrobia bacterium]|nr:flagellar biosynthesis protein FliQ [Verrucomicrobiota bacterium]
MNPESAVDLLKTTMLQAATLASPVLLTAMAVGLMVSLFQAVTSLHEQTLSFVPKLVAILGLMIFALPWMTRSLLEFTRAMIERMPSMTT